MEKKVFEAPVVTVTLFDEADILTLSPNESGNVPEVDFNQAW